MRTTGVDLAQKAMKSLSIGIGIYVAQICSFRNLKCNSGQKTFIHMTLVTNNDFVGAGK
jgi:hypothetical protein